MKSRAQEWPSQVQVDAIHTAVVIQGHVPPAAADGTPGKGIAHAGLSLPAGVGFPDAIVGFESAVPPVIERVTPDAPRDTISPLAGG